MTIRKDVPRYSLAMIRFAIANDRELDAQASKGWRFTHSTVVRDNDRKIVANMWTPRQPRQPVPGIVGGAPTTYLGWETDPAYESKDARFIVHARTALPRRADQLEYLAELIEALAVFTRHHEDCATNRDEECNCGYAACRERLDTLRRSVP